MSSATTTDDVIKAATSVARDAAEGRLDPALLQQQAADECRRLVGVVAGSADPLWPVQLEVARGVLAAGGIPVNELAEWLAVARLRADGADMPAAARTAGQAR